MLGVKVLLRQTCMTGALPQALLWPAMTKMSPTPTSAWESCTEWCALSRTDNVPCPAGSPESTPEKRPPRGCGSMVVQRPPFQRACTAPRPRTEPVSAKAPVPSSPRCTI